MQAKLLLYYYSSTVGPRAAVGGKIITFLSFIHCGTADCCGREKLYFIIIHSLWDRGRRWVENKCLIFIHRLWNVDRVGREIYRHYFNLLLLYFHFYSFILPLRDHGPCWVTNAFRVTGYCKGAPFTLP